MRLDKLLGGFVVGCLFSTTITRADTVYVKAGATGNGTGGSWANAFTSLSAAIDDAGTVAGDQVWVATGTYSGTVNLKSGVKVYGGFAGTETAPSQSNPEANVTIISGGGSGRAVQGGGLDGNTILRGFLVSDGWVTNDNYGAGLELVNSLAVIVMCEFTSNVAGLIGAGVHIQGGTPKFVNCKFHGHSGTSAAGAVFVRNSASPTFVNCLFFDNDTEEGGAVANLASEPTFINCTFVNNKAIVKPDTDPATHFPGKGAALFDKSGKAYLRNCITWHTQSGVPYGVNQIHNKPGIAVPTTVTHSDILGGWSGTGNINADPQFMDPANNDFTLSGPLSSTSPCKNTGYNNYLDGTDFADLDWDTVTDEQVPFDLTGVNPRIWLTTVDMGAYEWKKITQQQMSAPSGPDPTLEVDEAQPPDPTEPTSSP